MLYLDGYPETMNPDIKSTDPTYLNPDLDIWIRLRPTLLLNQI